VACVHICMQRVVHVTAYAHGVAHSADQTRAAWKSCRSAAESVLPDRADGRARSAEAHAPMRGWRPNHRVVSQMVVRFRPYRAVSWQACWMSSGPATAAIPLNDYV